MNTKDNITNNIDVEKIFANFPNHQYWKMLIDQAYWSVGPNYFDRDQSPGYLQSVSRALYYNLLTINQPLTADLILGLHGVAYHKQDAHFIGKFVEESRFSITLKDITQDGLAELIEHIRLKKTPTRFLELIYPANEDINDLGDLNPNAYAKYPEMDPLGHFKLDENKTSSELAERMLQLMKKREKLVFLRTSTIDQVFNQINEYIETYHQEISEAKDDNEKKLAAIVKLIHYMHIYHPFGDGNGRTFIFILLNKLLIMNGFTPSIVQDPALFSCWSVSELVKEVKEGQLLFKSICDANIENKDTKLTDYIGEYTNLNEDEFLFNKAKIDLGGFFEEYDSNNDIKEFIDKNRSRLLQLMTERYSFQTIKLVMDRIKPDMKEIQHLIDQAAINGNLSLFSYFAQHYQSHYPEIHQQLTRHDNIIKYLRNFNAKDGIKLLQQLPIQNTQYFELLINSSINTSYNNCESIFFTSLTERDYGNDYRGYIDYMLNQITTAQFMKLMNTDFNGINGVQLLTLFLDSDKFINHIHKLDISKRWELISLLKSQITSENEDVIKSLSTRKSQIDTAIKNITHLSGEKLSIANEISSRKVEQNQSQKNVR